MAPGGSKLQDESAIAMEWFEEGWDQIVVPGTENHADITDIIGGENYEVKIAAQDSNGIGQQTSTMSVKTLNELSSPPAPSGTLVKSDSDSMKIKWDAPESDSVVRGYSVSVKNKESDVMVLMNEKVEGRDNTELTVYNFIDPDTLYEVSVQSYNGFGDSSDKAIEVASTNAANLGEILVESRIPGKNSIQMGWSDTKAGSELESYIVKYNEAGSTANPMQVLANNKKQFTATQLKPSTPYEFYIKRASDADFSATPQVQASTLDDFASMPLGFDSSQTETGDSWASLQWEPPADPNGDLDSYKIAYTDDVDADFDDWNMFDTKSTATYQNLTGLSPGTDYNMKIAASNSLGDGEFSDAISISTKGEAPIEKMSV
jgi:hypothetical protein